jgi:hypothetical protein
MNPTQKFKFVMNWINQKIIKFNRVPLGRNHARPSRTARARPMATRGAAHVHGAGAAGLSLGRCSARGPARPTSAARVARRERARVAHDGGAARRAGGGTAPARGKQLKNGGSPAQGRRMAVWRRRARLRSGRRRA